MPAPMKRRSSTMGRAMVFRGRNLRIPAWTSPMFSENQPKPRHLAWRIDPMFPLIGDNPMKLQSFAVGVREWRPGSGGRKGNSKRRGKGEQKNILQPWRIVSLFRFVERGDESYNHSIV